MSAAQHHPVRMTPPSLAALREGNTGVPWVHERASGAGGPEVLLTCLVHGNEWSGAIVLADFLASGLQPRFGRITVAFCNVQAFARFDADQPDASRFVDEDFNRVWSADRLDGHANSQELQRARELRPFADRSTHLLDLHSMHEPGPPLLLTGTRERDIRFGRRLQSGVRIVIDEGHAEGKRLRDYEGGAAGGERVALLLEAGQHWDPSCLGVVRDTLARFLVASGAWHAQDVPASWRMETPVLPGAVRVTHAVVAESMDFRFTAAFRGGEVVADEGTVIAVSEGRSVRTPYADCVLVMPSVRQLRPGVTTVRFAKVVEVDR